MAHRFLRVVVGLTFAVLMLGAGAVPAVAAGAGAVANQELEDPPVDNDGDGIPDDEDQCPFEAGVPENYGCPYVGPIDSDGDGVYDDTDQCPSEPGSPAYYGCPVPDSDGDGLADDVDACPDQPGPYDGCPLTDLDGDGVYDDGSDLCPNEYGDSSYGGCPYVPPPTDSDGDGVNDDTDQCPDVPGLPEHNGCPPPEVTATAPTFTDRCGKKQDTVTVPTSTGVVYRRGGDVAAAGTYRVWGKVTIRAGAADGHVLSGDTKWSSTMTDEACPQGRVKVKSPARRRVRIVNREGVQMTIRVGPNVRKLDAGEVRTIWTPSGTHEWTARWQSPLISARSGSLQVL